MRAHILTALAAGCLLAGSGTWLVAEETGQPASQKAMKQLEGTWEIVSITQDGKKVAPAGEGKMLFIVKKGRWSVRKDNKTIESGTFKIDASTTPHHIDVTPASGRYSDQTLRGIYEVTGDTARDCFAMEPGKKRPKSFTANDSTGCRLTEYRRLQE